TEWVLLDIQIEGIDHGFGHGTVRLFAEDGTLMATASQSTIVRYWQPQKPGTRPQAAHVAPTPPPTGAPSPTAAADPVTGPAPSEANPTTPVLGGGIATETLP
nr:hypothetical protein [Acidimicrobiia bacterium]